MRHTARGARRIGEHPKRSGKDMSSGKRTGETREHDDRRESEQNSPEERTTEGSGASRAALSAADGARGGETAFYEYWNQMNFVTWMGARIVESSDGRALVYFEPGEHHRGAGIGGRAVTGAVQA